ncbi:UNKNOWN [Stylonychia lemnae]|uniref:Uncharacterized protein n=1 Tax=Stylonychia lemnae TaxID=5949 RepID=A0A078ACB2_STYLE|nr:UNKNOWN [Stylonychia lemnae]|eukprot:CDW79854.1 UNKNOWN [Stylonychia lemnae]
MFKTAAIPVLVVLCTVATTANSKFSISNLSSLFKKKFISDSPVVGASGPNELFSDASPFVLQQATSWFDSQSDQLSQVDNDCIKMAFKDCICQSTGDNCPADKWDTVNQCYDNSIGHQYISSYEFGKGNQAFTSNTLTFKGTITVGPSQAINATNTLDKPIRITISINGGTDGLNMMNTTADSKGKPINLEKIDTSSEIKFTLQPKEHQTIGLYDCSNGSSNKKYEIKAEKDASLYGLVSSIFVIVASISAIIFI